MFNIWPKLKNHPTQTKVWRCPERFVYLPCGRGSGKTELSLRRLVRYLPLQTDRHRVYFYGSPTFGQAKRVAWRRLKGLIPPNWITGISESTLTIQTRFNSELFLFGFDIPRRIEGLHWVDGGVLDECSDIKPGTIDLSVLPTMQWSKGWCWFIGIPKRFGVGVVEYQERYEAAVDGTLPDSAGFTWPSSEVMTEEQLAYARATYDERDFDEQYNAKWINASGGIFHAFDKEFNVRETFYDPTLPMIVAQDFNVNPMAWVLGHIKGETLEIFDEIWIRDTNTPEALKVLLNRYSQHTGGFQFYGDASSRGHHTSAYQTDYAHINNDARLKKMGMSMHYDVSNPPRADRFAETNARICDGNGNRWIYVDPKCKHLIYDLKTRTYKPGTREADDSNKDSGHPTDALGYICHKRWPLRLTPIGNSGIVIIKGR